MANPGGFYGRALAAAEQLQFAEARTIEGVQEELAAARVLLARLLRNPGADPEVVIKAAELVGKLVAIEHRVSRRADDALSAALADVLRQVGEITGIAGE